MHRQTLTSNTAVPYTRSMSKNDRQQHEAESAEVTVKLKPILGMRPGVYLTVLYGIAVLLLVYLLLFLPGIVKYGEYRDVVSNPPHAAVSVDGVYAGSTPCRIFVKHGDRVIEVSRPYYTPASFPQKIGGRVFFTLIVPQVKKITTTLPVADLPGLVKHALADLQKNPEISTIVSETAQAAGAPEARQELYDFVSNSMFVVTGESQLKQVILAAARTASNGGMLTPSSYVNLVQNLIQFKQKYDNVPSWLLLTLSRASGNKLAATPWLKGYFAAYRDALSGYYKPSALGPTGGGGGTISLQGIPFRSVPSGVLVMGRDENVDALGRTVIALLPHPVSIEQFYLGATEVTNAQYQAFVSETPEWAVENRQALVQKGLASDGYLATWTAGRFPQGGGQLPVTGVSWNAAQAYVRWLDTRGASSLPGYHAALPTEAQWEWAARGGLRGMPYPRGGAPGDAVLYKKGITGPSDAGTGEPNGYGLRDMIGNVWEWCADPFSWSAELFTSLDPRQNAVLQRALPESPDHVVRGGSWANQPGADKVYTRGYQPSEWCTPYLGFRVALTRQ
jgi:gamma-glutamyl hercynylcysteine S-oxide synthase